MADGIKSALMATVTVVNPTALYAHAQHLLREMEGADDPRLTLAAALNLVLDLRPVAVASTAPERWDLWVELVDEWCQALLIPPAAPETAPRRFRYTVTCFLDNLSALRTHAHAVYQARGGPVRPAARTLTIDLQLALDLAVWVPGPGAETLAAIGVRSLSTRWWIGAAARA